MQEKLVKVIERRVVCRLENTKNIFPAVKKYMSK